MHKWQLCVGSAAGLGRQDDAAVVKVREYNSAFYLSFNRSRIISSFFVEFVDAISYCFYIESISGHNLLLFDVNT